ncbi:MAG: RNA repair transcriptional activator RtcR [Planctomycetes bacterium]|nr:RNA repair transcriptional activator RtcR [Planctomycetota bacterium]
MSRPTVVIGLLGTTLDVGGAKRWDRWRPSVGICQQEDLLVSRFELLYPPQAEQLRDQIVADIAKVSPETQVRPRALTLRDPWDFEGVYAALHDFARGYPFAPDREDYLVHITTGTHVAQICLFLLTESRHIPGRLIQSGPKFRPADPAGEVRIIDLDLSKYNALAARFKREQTEGVAGLKSGIATRNAAFNRLIEELEHVAAHSTEPILITGPTGAGKSRLARRVYDLKKHKRQIEGQLVEVNCATLRGDGAMSTLFGHRKGAFTGAVADRPGLLRAADGGVLFLDEIGELGLDEQAMLLRALEEKRFLPLGADAESGSDFLLIAGTNRDLALAVSRGEFREDLLARINLWTFALPPLRERREDIEPNLEYELSQFAARTNRLVRFTTEARERYIAFAVSPRGEWLGNFRDLSASVTRMATMAPEGRISAGVVDREIERLCAAWERPDEADDGPAGDELARVFTAAEMAAIDRFDRAQLSEVLRVCRRSRSLSEAGRELFAASRAKRSSVNDSDRLRKYLARFGVSWQAARGE